MRPPLPAPRVLWCAALLGAAALASACQVEVIDHGTTPCNALTCAGCCTLNGVCLPGGNELACGREAGACRRCQSDHLCREGACVDPSAPDAGEPPKDGGTPCGPQTCSGCCSGELCVALPAQSIYQCGADGKACEGCAGEEARCELGFCVAPACRLRIAGEGPEGTVLDFKLSTLGATSHRVLMLENVGDGRCLIGAPRWLAGADLTAFSFGGQQVPSFEIEPQAQAALPVSFTPYAAQTWSEAANAFTFEVNDQAPTQCASGQPGCRRVVVKGVGQYSELEPRALFAPQAVALGEVTVGCRSAPMPLAVVNVSKDPLRVIRAQMSGPGFVLEPSPALPLVVPAWSTGLLWVRFFASAQGFFGGTLELELEGPVPGVRHLPLSAEGVATADRMMSRVQPGPAEVDVLFVVHSEPGGGATPAPHQELASALPQFLQRAQALGGGDYRVGVITSDGTSNSAGLLQGSTRFVTPSTADAAAKLSQNLAAGAWSGLDHSLETARLSALPPNSTEPLLNGSFFRPGTRLGLVFVGHGEESSGGPLGDYVSALRVGTGHLLPGEGLRAWGLLAGGGCGPGHRWREALSLFDGTCRTYPQGGAAPPLLQIADELFSPRRELALPTPLDLAQPLEVKVDGAPLPSSAYTMNSGAIRFGLLSTPEPGQQVQVSWQADCQP